MHPSVQPCWNQVESKTLPEIAHLFGFCFSLIGPTHTIPTSVNHWAGILGSGCPGRTHLRQCISKQEFWEEPQQLCASDILSTRSNKFILHVKILCKVFYYVNNYTMFSIYNCFSKQALRKLSQHHFISTLNDVQCGSSEGEVGWCQWKEMLISVTNYSFTFFDS